MLAEGTYQRRAAGLGAVLADRLEPLVGREDGHGLAAVRVRGLWAGLDIQPGGPSGRELCERLRHRGILAKDTHGSTIRLAPPLVVTEDEVGLLVDAVTDALQQP
jgi:ornithine--oxo-acid transaminase